MKIDVKITGADEVTRAFRGARAAVLDAWQKTITEHLEWGVVRIQREYRSATTTTDTATRVGTGNLRASYAQRTERRLRDLLGHIGVLTPNKVLKYAHVHEKDGETIITPKNAKNLAIPLAAARRPSGLAPSPREVPDLFLIPRWMILAKRLPGGMIQPWFALRKRVRVKGRPAIMPVGRRVAARLEPDLVADWQMVLGAR